MQSLSIESYSAAIRTWGAFFCENVGIYHIFANTIIVYFNLPYALNFTSATTVRQFHQMADSIPTWNEVCLCMPGFEPRPQCVVKISRQNPLSIIKMRLRRIQLIEMCRKRNLPIVFFAFSIFKRILLELYCTQYSIRYSESLVSPNNCSVFAWQKLFIRR